jgi:predicted ABC-type transport system involved in lysophospholipase L1 biosynthesis ATPase subunit
VVTITHDDKLVARADSLLRMQAGRILPSIEGGSI